VRYPQNTVTGELEGSIADAVALEGVTCMMKRVAVKLDHQPLDGPEGVDLVVADGDVDGGRR
jgi:hypothetical protein